MKKAYNTNGTYYGLVKKVNNDNNGNLVITMPGDFPGMAERNMVFLGGSIVYEDNDRIYIEH